MQSSQLIRGRSFDLLKAAGTVLSSKNDNGRLSILIYHRVLSQPDPMRPEEIDKTNFQWQMNLLARYFNVLPLTVAIRRLIEGRLPVRAVCITFDDGYADNLKIALPILQKLGLPAAFFIATGYLDGGRMWNDTVIEVLRNFPKAILDLSARELGIYHLNTIQARIATARCLINSLKYISLPEKAEHINYLESLVPSSLPNDLMMSSQQVAELHAMGMEIGAHSVNHPILTGLEKKMAWWEITECKEHLESLTKDRIKLFAYPNGKPGQDYLPEHITIVKKLGFEGAVTTLCGASTSQTDRWQLPRFRPWDNSPFPFMARLLWNYRLIP